MTNVPSAYRGSAARPETGARPYLNSAMLIASAINADGNLELIDAEAAERGEQATVEFCLDGEGGLYRRSAQGALPLDLNFLARSLSLTFGSLTPTVFHLDGERPGEMSFRFQGEDQDRRRMQLLHDAFSVYLIAFEERLV